MIAPMHLGGVHDIVQAVSCNLLQSSAVLCHLEGPVMSGNFLNMPKKIAEGEICQNGRMHVAYSLPDHRLCLGIGRQWSPVTFFNPTSSPMLSLTVPYSPMQSPTILGRPQAVPYHRRGLCRGPTRGSRSPPSPSLLQAIWPDLSCPKQGPSYLSLILPKHLSILV